MKYKDGFRNGQNKIYQRTMSMNVSVMACKYFAFFGYPRNNLEIAIIALNASGIATYAEGVHGSRQSNSLHALHALCLRIQERRDMRAMPGARG